MAHFTIKEISKEDCMHMIEKYHYSNTIPIVTKHFLGCFEGEKLVGTLTLGYGTRPRHTIQALFPSLNTTDYYEIGRMCMTDDMPRNSESQMISQVCHWIKRNCSNIKVLFTWADGSMGKPGYVYQACSFLYCGYAVTDFYLKDGVKMHPRGIRRLLNVAQNDPRITVRPTLEQMRTLGIEQYKGRQFKYVRFLCSKGEKTRLMNECLTGFQSYPKKEDLVWFKRDTENGDWCPSEQPNVKTDKFSL